MIDTNQTENKGAFFFEYNMDLLYKCKRIIWSVIDLSLLDP